MSRKRILRITAILLAMVLMVGMSTGCQKKVETPKGVGDQIEDKKASTDIQENKSEEDNKISIFIQGRSEVSLEKNPIIAKALQEKANVNIEWNEAPVDDEQAKTKFNLMITSGEIPDIVDTKFVEDMIKVAQRGLFMPINDLLDEKIPNFKKVLDADPLLQQTLKMDDGNYYFFPYISAVRPAKVFMVRQDWLDNAGVKAPTNLDEFYNVLKAFKEKDPNKNGEADEIPFVTRDKHLGLMYIAQSFGLYGFEDTTGFMVKDGKVKYPYMQPEMKEALIYLNKLYAEGLIDQEYAVTDKQSWTAKITNEISGMTYDWFPRIDSFTSTVRETNPEADFIGILPPAGPRGDVLTESQQDTVRAVAAISKNTKKVDAIARLFNFIYSEEGTLLLNFGIKDTHYTIENGEPKFTKYVLEPNDQGQVGVYILFKDGNPDYFAKKTDIRYENAFASDEIIKVRDMYDKVLVDMYPTVAHTQDELDILNDKYSDIQTYTDEMINHFIMGIEPISNFDSYVEQLKVLGIEEIVAVKQKAYERFMNK